MLKFSFAKVKKSFYRTKNILNFSLFYTAKYLLFKAFLLALRYFATILLFCLRLIVYSDTLQSAVNGNNFAVVFYQ